MLFSNINHKEKQSPVHVLSFAAAPFTLRRILCMLSLSSIFCTLSLSSLSYSLTMPLGVLGKQRGSTKLLSTFVTDDALRGAINAVSNLDTILLSEFDNEESGRRNWRL